MFFKTILFPVVNPPGNLHSEQLFSSDLFMQVSQVSALQLVYYYPYPYPMRVLAWNPSSPLWDARFNGETKLFAASRHLRPEWPEIRFGIWFTWLETNLWDTLKFKKKVHLDFRGDVGPCEQYVMTDLNSSLFSPNIEQNLWVGQLPFVYLSTWWCSLKISETTLR